MIRKMFILCAVALLMVACGKFDDTKTTKRVVISTGLWSDPEERDFVVREVLEPFTKKTGIEIDLQSVAEVDAIKRAKLQKETGNISIDLIISHTGDMPNWVEKKYVQDITEIASGFTERTFIPAFDAETKFDGKTYYLPIAADVYLLLANIKAMDYLPKGYNIEELTWEQYANWSNAIRKGTGSGKTVATGIPMKSLLYQVGAATLSYGGNFPDVTSKGARKAWDIYGQMSGDFIKSVKNVDNVVGPMRRGEAWLTVLHNARAGQVYASNETGYRIAPAPIGPAGRGTIAGAYGVGLMNGAPNEELAKEVMEFLTRPETQMKLSKGAGGFIPPVEEALKLLGDEPEDQIIKQAMKVLKNGALSGTNASQIVDFGALKEVYDRLFDKVLTNGKVTDADLEKAGKELDKLIK